MIGRPSPITVGRFLGPVAIGFGIGWELGTLIWGNPFAVPGGTPAYNIPPGWDVQCDTGLGRDYWRWEVDTIHGTTGLENSGLPNCGIGAQLDLAHPEMNPTAGTSQFGAANFIDVHPFEPTLARVRTSVIFTWTGPGLGTDPGNMPTLINPTPAIYGDPVLFPEAFPELAPIGYPGQPVPNTFPEAVPRPGTQPSENPLTWPSTRPSPVVPVVMPPGLPTAVVPSTVVPSPGSLPVPVVIPTVIVEVSPGGAPTTTVITNPGPHRREPPGPTVVERKAARPSGAAYHGALHVVNVFTETLDFVDSLYDAVKPLVPPGTCANHDYACKLGVLYDHWDDPRFDAGLFVESWINNQMEDYLFGQLGRATGGASRGVGVTTGVGRGTGASNHLSGELDLTPDQQFDSPIPQLDYDPETGAWAITWLGYSTPSYGG